MTVFYAYIHSITNDNISRCVMVFSSRKVADELWRAISGSDNAKYFQRINPQFYTHHGHPTVSIEGLFNEKRFESIRGPFRGKMFMTLIDDRTGRNLPVIPSQDFADHVSGNWFYIRSKSDPSLYWYLNKGRLFVSDRKRTQFQIRGRDLEDGIIMIGSDTVTLQVDSRRTVDLDGAGSLVESCVGYNFRFDDLENGLVCIQEELEPGVGDTLYFDAQRRPAQHSWELV